MQLFSKLIVLSSFFLLMHNSSHASFLAKKISPLSLLTTSTRKLCSSCQPRLQWLESEIAKKEAAIITMVRNRRDKDCRWKALYPMPSRVTKLDYRHSSQHNRLTMAREYLNLLNAEIEQLTKN